MLEADQILLNTEKLIGEIEIFLKESRLLNRYGRLIDSLKEELTTPCVLAIAGKVKAGKSSLLNALLGVDLAMTGTTETTATINVFKGGNPVDSAKPILCIYLDGTQEWKPKSYLDELQGTSEKALSEASKIDKLVFYVADNPMLNNITIVDTPGIGAQVGNEGDSHQIQTDAYFKLRERHRNETTSISNSADAVIYLFDTVPTELDKSFLSALYNGGNGLTAFNGVGVLSKIDRDISMIDNVSKFKALFEKQLFSIVPASSALYHYLPSYEAAVAIRQMLREGFESMAAFKQAVMSEFAFLHPNLPKCKLSLDERRKILSLFKDDNFQWSTFQLIVNRIYNAENMESELSILQDISGIKILEKFISDHFFKRAHLLRCNKIISEIRTLLTSIQYSKSFIENEYRASLKESCVESCRHLPIREQEIIIRLIEENIPSLHEIKKTKSSLSKIKDEADDLRLQLSRLNSSIIAYHRLMSDKSQFSESEISELEKLFCGQDPEANIISRLKYWNSVYNCSRPNSIRQNAAAAAKNMYQNKLANETD